MDIVTISTPNQHLAAPITRKTHGPRLYWVETSSSIDRGGVVSGGSLRRYITVDVIPSLDHGQASKITEFPVQDGTVYSDHVVHFPDALTLEIVQTNEPFEDVNEDGELVVFDYGALPLSLPPTNFRPRGLLALSLLGEGLVLEGLNEIGIDRFNPIRGPEKIAVQKPPNPRDRINELLDKLTACRLEVRLLNLDWLGRVWTNIAIETINYKRAVGKTSGSFTVTVKQFTTTTTDTATVRNPAEPRLRAETTGGQRPAVELKPSEKKDVEAAASESLLHMGADSAGLITT